jgi:hypothetical protein
LGEKMTAGDVAEGPNSEPSHSATAVKVFNIVAFVLSIPLWPMARRAATWSGGAENWDEFIFMSSLVLIIHTIVAVAVRRHPPLSAI